MTDEADTTASVPPGASSSGTTAPPEPPPWSPGPSFSRQNLVRPRQGRYVAGVCAALARATNTDPVLWRVLVAVLGILSGVGVLLYLIGWLIIPSEGDSASPIEGLLGRGRSGMAPFTVVLLGAVSVLLFGLIVHNGMPASLVAAAVIVGVILLIKRNGGSSAPSDPGPAATFPPPADQVPPPGSAAPTAQFAAPPPGAPATEEPVTTPIPPMPPMLPMPPMPPTPGGYRPPFAPHGPWASSNVPPAYQPPQPPPRAPRPPKPPRERSKLGRLTFFAVIVVIGLMAVLGMAGAHITVSAYFAAALVTVALGLVVGAWFGRARGLIALAILLSIGLGVSTGVERWGGQVGNSIYRPQSVAEIADRYDFTAGNVTLDLSAIDFTGQSETITLTMKLGQLRVLLPPTVDTTATLSLDTGRAMILGHQYDGRSVNDETVTDLGSDGNGGGTLKLDLQMDTGSVEVNR
ncbi:PspC domain-containing protein [Actinoplanes subtropicus]|uniref:PspC domain-containing protein n=1 Tax=Actinoplanes subtropicus TaxID=543632 RepID=UPI0004C4033B|nr:PspC domain-containing protein [Actinoplanes subtropicus]